MITNTATWMARCLEYQDTRGQYTFSRDEKSETVRGKVTLFPFRGFVLVAFNEQLVFVFVTEKDTLRTRRRNGTVIFDLGEGRELSLEGKLFLDLGGAGPNFTDGIRIHKSRAAHAPSPAG